MNFSEKQAYREDAAARLDEANAVILAEYRGLSMAQVTNLRTELRKHNASFRICKNRILKKAIESNVPGYTDLSSHFKGPIGIVTSTGDVAQVTKAALEFEKNNESFKVTAGFFDNAVLSPADLKVISDLPSREVLLGQIVGSLVAPHRGILGVLSGVSRQLVQVINAIKDQKSQ